jgi:archaellum component FlaG (FlaF/FlaG flagellin family)
MGLRLPFKNNAFAVFLDGKIIIGILVNFFHLNSQGLILVSDTWDKMIGEIFS